MVTALAVTKAFFDNWVFVYGAPARLLSDNGAQFTSQMFQAACKQLGTKNVFTTAYHPQTNGQTERFNRTMLAGLRAFVGTHPRTCHEYAGTLTYAYNTQVHATTDMPPFDLFISRPPPPSFVRREPSSADAPEPRLERLRFIKDLRRLTAMAASKSIKANSRYKKQYDARIKPLNTPKVVDSVYIRREAPMSDSSEQTKRRHKLQPRAEGPYKVVATTSHTLTVNRDVLRDNISISRVAKAPDDPSPLVEDLQPMPAPTLPALILTRAKKPTGCQHHTTRAAP